MRWHDGAVSAMPTPVSPVRRAYLARRSQWRRTFAGEVVSRAFDLQLVSRATVLSTQQVACLAPLAVGLMAMMHPSIRANIGREFAKLFGLDHTAAASITSLFAASETIATSTGIVGLLLLIGWASGVPGYTQRLLEDIWAVPPSNLGRALVARMGWLVGFGAVVAVLGLTTGFFWWYSQVRILVLVCFLGVQFLAQWRTNHLLLGRRVTARRLALGSVLSTALIAGLIAVLALYGSPVIDETVAQFGLIGITFLVQATAVAFAFSQVLGELLGAELDRRSHPERWPDDLISSDDQAMGHGGE